jgi:hypothetical protein
MKTLLPASLAVLVASTAASAQTIPDTMPSPPRGTLVRVVGPSTQGDARTGRVVGATDGAVQVATGRWRRRVLTATPADSLYVGSRRNHLGAALVGLFGGAALGAAAGATVGFAAETFTDRPTGDHVPPVGGGATLGAIAGAPLGAFVLGSQGFRVWTRVWPVGDGGGRGVGVAVMVAGR